MFHCRNIPQFILFDGHLSCLYFEAASGVPQYHPHVLRFARIVRTWRIVVLTAKWVFFWLRQVLVAAHRIFVEACGIFRYSVQALHCGAQASL